MNGERRVAYPCSGIMTNLGRKMQVFTQTNPCGYAGEHTLPLLIEAKNLHHGGKCRRLLSSAWVVEEESGEWLAPVLKNPHEFSFCKIWRRFVFRYEDQTNAIQRSSEDQFEIVYDQWSICRHGQFLLPFSNSYRYNSVGLWRKLMQLCCSRARGSFGFGCDRKYSGEATMACQWSGETRTAIMSFSMYSPK